MKIDSLSLSQLNQKIKSIIHSGFPDLTWVIAEISEMRLNSSGHCYLELIEKAEDSDQIVAKVKATIWSFTYRMLAPYFETTTGYRLVAGLKVLVRVQPEFHGVFGLSLIIKDIDPSYTLGDLARIKRETIRKLQSEGVIDMNRMLPFPLVPQRIAVISSETAAGYGDFLDTLLNNSNSYFFYCELFAALMQGENAAESIINSLDRIFQREDEFDVVVIIRGGGAQSDLDCFNNYDLVYHITQFPLPVISGIGHERDETITDIVAHTSVKTPTAVAEFLIDAFADVESRLDGYRDLLLTMVTDRISDEKQKLVQLSQNTVFLVQENLNEEKNILNASFKRLALISQQFLVRKSDKLITFQHRIVFDSGSQIRSAHSNIELTFRRFHRSLQSALNHRRDQLSAIEKNLEYLSPEKVLMRGYSISSSGGQIIKNAGILKEGDELTTRFGTGNATSIIKRIKKK